MKVRVEAEEQVERLRGDLEAKREELAEVEEAHGEAVARAAGGDGKGQAEADRLGREVQTLRVMIEGLERAVPIQERVVDEQLEHALRQRVEQIEAERVEVQGEIGGLNADKTVLREQVRELDVQLSSLGRRMDGLNVELARVRVRLTVVRKRRQGLT